MKRHRPCPHCNHDTNQEISKQIAVNNAEQFGWWCQECHRWALSKQGNLWISKEDLIKSKIDLATVPIVKVAIGNRCSHCGRRGAEEHHWAPKAIFGEGAYHWPTDYLCKSCHDEWHKRVTPQL